MSRNLSKKEEQKEQYQQQIFEKFAIAANTSHQLGIEVASISNQRPPLPDIYCTILGRPHYFEITEIVDEGLAKNVTTSIKETVKTKKTIIPGVPFSQDNPLLKAFTQKAGKSYSELDGPLELLAFYQKQYPPSADLLTPETLCALNLIVAQMTGQAWWRVWIFNCWNDKIIGSVSR